MTEEERIRLLEERTIYRNHVRDLRSTLRDIARALADHRAHPTFSAVYDMTIASLERNDPK